MSRIFVTVEWIHNHGMAYLKDNGTIKIIDLKEQLERVTSVNTCPNLGLKAGSTLFRMQCRSILLVYPILLGELCSSRINCYVTGEAIAIQDEACLQEIHKSLSCEETKSWSLA